MKNIIEVNNLYKYFGDVHAVDDISFTVKTGELFAFLGLNGAGKSTTINVICSILRKDSGSVSVAGFDIDRQASEVKNRIGIVFQGSILDERLSVWDNLAVRASYYGLRGAELKRRIDELTEWFDLGGLLKRPFGKLSGGQRRRVDFARGLINLPSLLILDEPTTGLDPQTRSIVWERLNSIRRDTGMTVFLTTHYMEEAEDADKVVIMDSGKIVAEGSPIFLKNKYSGDYIRLYRPESPELNAALEAANAQYEYWNGSYRIKTSGSDEARKFIVSHPELCTDFEVIKGNMDDVFLRATGKKLVGSVQ